MGKRRVLRLSTLSSAIIVASAMALSMVQIGYTKEVSNATSIGDKVGATVNKEDSVGVNKLPVPPSFLATAAFERKQYFIGEDVLLNFHLKNTGTERFKIEMGGDYRFAPRSLRYIVSAVAANGEKCDDPFPDAACEGGLGGESKVKQGEEVAFQIPFNKYVRIDQPGTYKVTIAHDFGWRETKASATCDVEFVVPTESQARDVVHRLTESTKNHGDDGRSLQSLYFSLTRHPIYLPIFKEMAKQELTQDPPKKKNYDGTDFDFPSISGIASIATPEASEALLEIAESGNPAMSLQAAQSLNLRLPDPIWDGDLGARSAFENLRTQERKRLVKLSWTPAYSDRYRAVGAKLLKRSAVHPVQCGAYVFECIGTASDASVVSQALDVAISETKNMKPEVNYPRPRGATGELMRTVAVLIKRGFSPSSTPRTPGEKVFFLTAIGKNSSYRPVGWKQTYMTLLQDGIPYIREVGLLNVSSPFYPEIKHLMPALLADKDPDVQIAASTLLENSADLTQKDAVLDKLRTSRDFVQFNSAENAAEKLGLHFEALEITAARLSEPDPKEALNTSMFHFLSHLIFTCIDLPAEASIAGGGRSHDDNVKSNWLKLLAKNEKLFRANGKISLNDPQITKNLFPSDFQIVLSNGKNVLAGNESAEQILNSVDSLVSEAERNIRDQDERASCEQSLSEALSNLQTVSHRDGADDKPEPGALKVSERANNAFRKILVLKADLSSFKQDWHNAVLFYGQALINESEDVSGFKTYAFAKQEIPQTQVLTAYEKMLARATKNSGNNSIDETSWNLIMLAKAYDMQKEFAIADPLYLAAIPNLHSNDFRHLSAEAASRRKEEVVYKQDLVLAENELKNQSQLLATRYEFLARFYGFGRENEKALSYYSKAIEWRKSSAAPNLKMLCFDLTQEKVNLEALKKDAAAKALNSDLLKYLYQLHNGQDSVESLLVLQNEELPALENADNVRGVISILKRLEAFQLKAENSHTKTDPRLIEKKYIHERLKEYQVKLGQRP